MRKAHSERKGGQCNAPACGFQEGQARNGTRRHGLQAPIRADDLNKQIFQRQFLWGQLIHIHILRDQVAVEFRAGRLHLARSSVTSPSSARTSWPHWLNPASTSGVKPAGAQGNACFALHQRLELADAHNLAVFDKGHPVAGDFDLTEQVGV